jgi:hypothetical protein
MVARLHSLGDAMNDRPARILPTQLVTEIGMYVDDQFNRAAKYDNAEVLDDSGVYDLHTLAARIYAEGWQDGERAEGERQRHANRRRSG